MTGTLSPTATRPADLRPIATQGPQPGFWETFRAGFRVAEDEQELTQAPELAERYDALLDTLRDLGVDTSPSGPLYRDAQSSIPGALARHRVPDRDAIIAEVNRQRDAAPGRFGTVGKTREEFERQVVQRFGGRARDQRALGRGNSVAGFGGQLASGMTDPYNLATLPAGAGQVSIWRTALIEGLAGAGSELPNLPGTARAKERLGEPYTVGDAVEQVVISGLASAALGAGLRGVELGVPRARDAADQLKLRLNNAVIDNWDRLPNAVRSRLAGGQWDKLTPAQRDGLRATMEIADNDLPEIAESLIGRTNMSADERAAVDGLRRSSEVAATSPFKPGPAGDSVHAKLIDERLAELLQPVERRPYSAIVGQRAPGTARADLMSGTSLSSGGTPSGARAAVKARIRQAESGGSTNPDTARNPLSSATGRYQFTSGTWLAYYKRRFGSRGLSDAQILAKRSDGVLQETLMDDLTADNARFLRSVGEAESAGNLYLTHFAGQGGARKLFAADPNALAGDVLGAGVVRANPWMRGMTVGDLIGWAHRKMSEPAPRRAGARAELAEDRGDTVAAVQAEIDRLSAEEDAARAARDAESEERIAAAIENDIVPVEVGEPVISPPPVSRDVDTGLADREAALLPKLREEIAGSARLSDLKGLAARLEASEAEVRRALERLAATEKALIVQRADGTFRRAPVESGPVDAFKFLARAGGIADDEGHELIERFGIDARTTRTDELTGKRVGGTRRQSVMIPAAGPLVRKGGMSIDRAGEMLFEAGYLRGADGGRPTVADTLAYLERGMSGAETRRTMVPLADLSTIDEWVEPETLADMRAHMLEWANYQDVDLSGDDIDALARLMLREDIANEDEALAELTHLAIVDALDDMRYESGDYDDAFARYLDSIEPDSRGERFEADPGNAGESDARIAPAGIVDVEEVAATAQSNGIDDPLTAAISDSVTHDMDALHGAPVEPATLDLGDAVDPAIAARQAEEMRLRAASPMRSIEEQDGTMGLPMFDRADQGELTLAGASDPVTFYLDENGEARSWSDIAAELDAEEAEIQAMRACL